MKGLIAAVLALVAIAAQADCVSSNELISLRANDPNRAAGPIAWTGSVLGVAKNENNAAKSIWFGLYDEQAILIRETKVVDASFDGAQALLWTGSDFGLYYIEPLGGHRYQRVAADGTPIGGAVVMPHGIFPEDEFDFAWDATRDVQLVLHRVTQGPETGLWLTGVARDGSIRFDRMLYSFVATIALPRVAVASNGTIGIFFNHASVVGTSFIRVDAQERYLAPVTISPVATGDVAVAVRGNQFGVARQVAITGGKTEIRWMVVDTNATTVVSERLLVSPRGIDVAPVALVATPNEWALGYDDSALGFRTLAGEYRLRRFTQTGTTISDTQFSADRLRSTFLTRHPFIWTGNAFVSSVSMVISAAQGSDSYLVRHCPLIGRPSTDKSVVRLLDPINFTASASGGTPDYTYEWDLGDLSRVENGATIQHKYDRYGTYTITLTTRDVAGATHVTTTTVKVVAGKNRAVR